jgi:uncharacterized membrane protein YczE
VSRGLRVLKHWLCLFAGFFLCGLAIACMVKANLGLGPWDAFHQGIARQTGLSMGHVQIVASVAVMLTWIPLRQKPGIGTVLNALLIGFMTDFCLAHVPEGHGLVMRWAMLLAGLLLMGLSTALYLPTKLGAGPRDGLMMGIVRRFGLSVRVARASVEIVVLTIGWLLGGTIGAGTVVYAFGIGPVVHWMLDAERKWKLVG